MRRNYIGRVQVVRRTNLGEGGSGRERSEGEKLEQVRVNKKYYVCTCAFQMHVFTFSRVL